MTLRRVRVRSGIIMEAIVFPFSYSPKTCMSMHNDARFIRKNAWGKIEKYL